MAFFKSVLRFTCARLNFCRIAVGKDRNEEQATSSAMHVASHSAASIGDDGDVLRFRHELLMDTKTRRKLLMRAWEREFHQKVEFKFLQNRFAFLSPPLSPILEEPYNLIEADFLEEIQEETKPEKITLFDLMQYDLYDDDAILLSF